MTTKTRNILTWIAAGLSGGLLAVSGITKIVGVEMQIQNLQSWGYPLWFRFPIGLTDLLIGLALLIPQFRKWGAYAVYPWFLVAAYTHLQATPSQAAMLVAPLFFVVLATAVLLLNRNSETK